MSESTAGVLYIVGTPIGNLEDMTFRAVRILQSVDVIAAEDTRHTGKLLQHFQIKTPQISYYEHNQQQRIPELLNRLESGTIALVTDAGIPGISDPGYELVKASIEAGFKVVPIPGCSAVTTALSASGLPTERFIFEGFLPNKGKVRKQYLDALKTETRTIVFYEAPHRIKSTLQDLKDLGETRKIVIARELTKLYEEFWRGTIEEAIAYFSTHEPRGEFTIILAGAELVQLTLSEAEIKAELQQLIGQGITRSQASRDLAKSTSLPRRQLYQIALTIPEETE